jgi:serine/threonine-protein kinase HipA
MATSRRRALLVYADWNGINSEQWMGTLHAELLRGKEIFSFEYAPNWLESDDAQLLDPDLQLYSGKSISTKVPNLTLAYFWIHHPTGGEECL